MCMSSFVFNKINFDQQNANRTIIQLAVHLLWRRIKAWFLSVNIAMTNKAIFIEHTENTD